MNLRINGIDKTFQITGRKVVVLEILNKTYAGRIISSLISGLDEEALEPIVVWNEDGKIGKSKNNLLIIPSVFDLPWDNRSIVNKQFEKIASLVLESHEFQAKIESTDQFLRQTFLEACLQLSSDYDFSKDWDVTKYLKAFGFGIENDALDTHFDNVKKFIHMIADINYDRAVCFIGLKQYFSIEELNEIYDLCCNLKIPVIDLETSHDENNFINEDKTIVDQHFLII